MKRFAVAIILNPEGLMLMGKRNDNGLWTNPAGHCNPKEDAHHAVCREVKEETGLDVREAHLVHAGMNSNGNMLYVFLCRVEGKIDASGDPDQECPDWSWENPVTKIGNLHVPAADNYSLQWYLRHYRQISALKD
jgi:8-oxo-dGTP pyrophosphatase MutT (NUDIX family)